MPGLFRFGALQRPVASRDEIVCMRAGHCLIITFMARPASISTFTVDVLSVLRNVEIGANAPAIIQIFALSLAGAIWK